jgi:hypothetical protein
VKASPSEWVLGQTATGKELKEGCNVFEHRGCGDVATATGKELKAL